MAIDPRDARPGFHVWYGPRDNPEYGIIHSINHYVFVIFSGDAQPKSCNAYSLNWPPSYTEFDNHPPGQPYEDGTRKAETMTQTRKTDNTGTVELWIEIDSAGTYAVARNALDVSREFAKMDKSGQTKRFKVILTVPLPDFRVCQIDLVEIEDELKQKSKARLIVPEAHEDKPRTEPEVPF